MFEHLNQRLRAVIDDWRSRLTSGPPASRFILAGFESETRVMQRPARRFFSNLASRLATGEDELMGITNAIGTDTLLSGPRVDSQVPSRLARICSVTTILEHNIAPGSGRNINYGINRMPGRRHRLDYGEDDLLRDVRRGGSNLNLYGNIQGRKPMVWSADAARVRDVFRRRIAGREIAARSICDILGLGFGKDAKILILEYVRDEVRDEAAGFCIPTVLDGHSGEPNCFFRPAPAGENRSGWTVNLKTGKRGLREWVHPSFPARGRVELRAGSVRQLVARGLPSTRYLKTYDDDDQ